jgi:hypothetical protein
MFPEDHEEKEEDEDRESRQNAGWARHQVHVKSQKAIDDYRKFLKRCLHQVLELDEINEAKFKAELTTTTGWVGVKVENRYDLLSRIAMFVFDMEKPTKSVAKGIKRLIKDYDQLDEEGNVCMHLPVILIEFYATEFAYICFIYGSCLS